MMCATHSELHPYPPPKKKIKKIDKLMEVDKDMIGKYSKILEFIEYNW